MEQMNENQLKMKRAEELIKVGEYYYQQYRMGQFQEEAMKEQMKNVADLDLKIAQVTGACVDVEGVCPQCNNQIEEGSAFCQNCGFSLKEYTEQFVGNCKHCNAKIRNEQKFCEVCGVLLELNE